MNIKGWFWFTANLGCYSCCFSPLAGHFWTIYEGVKAYFYEGVYLWRCISMKAYIYEGVYLWRRISMKAYIYEGVFLWRRISMKAYIYERVYLWRRISMNAYIYEDVYVLITYLDLDLFDVFDWPSSRNNKLRDWRNWDIFFRKKDC